MLWIQMVNGVSYAVGVFCVIQKACNTMERRMELPEKFSLLCASLIGLARW